jgi:hypothetical protein
VQRNTLKSQDTPNLLSPISNIRAVTLKLYSRAPSSSGKKYWELIANTILSAPDLILEGLANSSAPLNYWPGVDLNGIGWSNAGKVWMGDAPVATVQGWAQGDVLSFAVDLGSKRIWFRVNANNWNNNAASDPATNTGGIDISSLAAGPYFAFGHVRTGQEMLTANFGGSPYAQSVPSGFSNW